MIGKGRRSYCGDSLTISPPASPGECFGMPVACGTRNSTMCDSLNSRQILSLRVAGQQVRPLGREWVRRGVGMRAIGHTMAIGIVISGESGALTRGRG